MGKKSQRGTMLPPGKAGSVTWEDNTEPAGHCHFHRHLRCAQGELRFAGSSYLPSHLLKLIQRRALCNLLYSCDAGGQMDAAAHLMLRGEVWRRRSGYFKPGFSVCCGKGIPMWPKKKKKRLEESWRRLKLRKAEAHSIVWVRINAWKPVRTMLKTDYLHSWGFGRETVLLYSSLGLGRLQSFRRSGTAGQEHLQSTC